jgi:hypothetical protein
VTVRGQPRQRQLYYQEAAWIYQEAGNESKANAILKELERIFNTQHISSERLWRQGVSESHVIIFSSSVKAIYKPEKKKLPCKKCKSGKELAAYKIDRYFGFNFTPFTIQIEIKLKDGKCEYDESTEKVVNPNRVCPAIFGSLQYWLKDTKNAVAVGLKDNDKSDKLRLFHAIIGNGDGHSGNWLVDTKTKKNQFAIDNDDAFNYKSNCWDSNMYKMKKPQSVEQLVDSYKQSSDKTINHDFGQFMAGEYVVEFIKYRSKILKVYSPNPVKRKKPVASPYC